MPKFIPVNQQFFDNWSPEMAYVLGFFAADGCLTVNPRGSKYIEFVSTDNDVLRKIRKTMGSKHKIGPKNEAQKGKKAFRLQIGSQYIFERLETLGFSVCKSKSIQFPAVPKDVLRHFVRGNFDGDGFVASYSYPRKNRGLKVYTYVMSGFAAGNKEFLSSLHKKTSFTKSYYWRKLITQERWL